MSSHCYKVGIPRKQWYNITRESSKDVRTNAETEETTVGSMTRGAQISCEQPCDRAPLVSSLANRAPASCINELFCAPHNNKRLAPSSTADDPQTPTDGIETRHHDEVADHQLEDEDYNLEADEVSSFDDHIDDLFAAQEVEGQNNDEKCKDTDYWNVTINEDGMRKRSKLSVKEAITLPSNTKIILPFNKEFWKLVNKAKKEYAYDMIKRVFYYEDDAGGKIKHGIMQRIGKKWKDTRHNLYHKCYKEIRTFEENLKLRPSEIEENHWKWKNQRLVTFYIQHHILIYIYSKKCKKDEVDKEQGRPVDRGELFIITYKKKMVHISIPMRVLLEAIANVERPDESSKHLSQNDSLAQVLEKEQLGRVCVLGTGPCPTQEFGNVAGQPSGSGEPSKEYERRIAKLTVKIEEEQAKRQSIEKVLGYIIQQQGGNLPPDIAVEQDYLGSTPTSLHARPSSSGNHDRQQK
ncbi:hypothetical protein Ahy_A10g048918 [Arachis hypogaea]|uniref:Uncharacterized protein n=1 Tax=Arachis hypogaea TaxID=3818 RepID=A0A445B689_ARAHY|nr:hypothetical protein Ahy_A10g048918 [Arachis hypogaea]